VTASRCLFMLLMIALLTAGCLPTKKVATGKQDVLPPLDEYLPVTLKVHSFTRIGDFEGEDFGIEAYIQAIDSWGEPTKAFGNFRFELYEFQSFETEKKGNMLDKWEVYISQAEDNRSFWHHHTRSYHFMLRTGQRIPIGTKVILRMIFDSPFSDRIITEKTFHSGD